jgi:hypothetical protein
MGACIAAPMFNHRCGGQMDGRRTSGYLWIHCRYDFKRCPLYSSLPEMMRFQ